MRFQVDKKFLGTWVIALLVMLVVVTLALAVAGVPAATVVAVAMGLLMTKTFDRLEYVPHDVVRINTSIASPSWLFGALVSTLILYGSQMGLHLWVEAWGPSLDNDTCPPVTMFAPGLLLDWGGYVLAGWLIARLFGRRALGFVSAAAVATIVVGVLDWRTADVEQAGNVIANCLGVTSPPMESRFGSLHWGMLAGTISRAFLAILVTRWTLRAAGNPALSPDIEKQ